MGNQGSSLTSTSSSSLQPEAQDAAGTCPVPERYRSTAVYNVYGQRIDQAAEQDPLATLRGADLLDTKNNMPLEANQQPCPGQRRPLSIDRVPSSIPKGGTDMTWLYPSPQMFYNALKRKGKGNDVQEEDMEAVVRAHNSMNETTWQRVYEWEQLHLDECGSPTLLRFQGKPDQLSPLARLRQLLGGPLPFDRHDWFVDRCGKEVRYVIDFYFNEDKAGTPEAFDLVVRPALDSTEAAVDRLRMLIYTKFAQWGLPCPVTGHEGKVGPATSRVSGETGANTQTV